MCIFKGISSHLINKGTWQTKNKFEAEEGPSDVYGGLKRSQLGLNRLDFNSTNYHVYILEFFFVLRPLFRRGQLLSVVGVILKPRLDLDLEPQNPKTIGLDCD